MSQLLHHRSAAPLLSSGRRPPPLPPFPGLFVDLEKEDKISNLPDFIIGHILSFLPTKIAVATSVLSKSWRYKWTFITKLDFIDEEKWFTGKEINKEMFLNFVNRVLLHLNSSSIESAKLTLIENYHSYVDQWMSAVVRRGVKKLCIDSAVLSSHSLMEFMSLEQLGLSVHRCVNIKLPSFACLSSLTVLHLRGISLIGETCNNSGNIHLIFPLLRNYKTEDCTWSSSLKYVTLEAPLLEVVSIQNATHKHPYPTIKFCASRLIEFAYDDYPLPDPIVFDLSEAHIVDADIHIGWTKDEQEQEIMVLSSKILKQFKTVECLKFQKWSSKVLLAKDSLANIPSFEMLSYLELGDVTGEILLALLLKAPNLKTLVFQNLLQSDQELLNYDPVPECLLTTLQVVKFEEFKGSEHQLNFAKFVMGNALALKKMSKFNEQNVLETVALSIKLLKQFENVKVGVSVVKEAACAHRTTAFLRSPAITAALPSSVG
ncbi:F-box/FBD/LRR-repeat protein At3g14710-like [Lotus japonicus]|uniref:F-box/FBD/LRR-repeat protein At3g14710-like n=1 Tax=Lotus japonicus TaxID=34305 RepID=UPI002583E571|nr:F-box/FBD/LRR-repeat protein At3g14710-like [Lotus japonicus]